MDDRYRDREIDRAELVQTKHLEMKVESWIYLLPSITVTHLQILYFLSLQFWALMGKRPWFLEGGMKSTVAGDISENSIGWKL